METAWTETLGEGPLVALAVHDGHAVRADVAPRLAVRDADRLREEDPFTGAWAAAMAPTRLIGTRSRFEVDLNRPPEGCVYVVPEDAWGIRVWKDRPPDPLLAESRAIHAAFYARLEALLREVQAAHGRFVVFDLHTYNHRRGGPEAPPESPEANPQVNVGTGTMTRGRWDGVVDRFLAELRAVDFPGGSLDVRENVRFRGGYVPRFVHETFPETGCAIAIEFKKFFMDEWTGTLDENLHAAITRALRATVPGVLEELTRA